MKKYTKIFAVFLAALCITIVSAGCQSRLVRFFTDFGGSSGGGQTTSVDAAKMTNDITTDKIHALFTVSVTCRSGFFGGSTLRSQGSGVAFYKQSGYVFLLTNCHVAAKREGYSQVSYTVTDYAGNEYTAQLFKNPGKTVSAISPDYDLACLYFKTSVDYTTLDIADSDPVKNQTVVALGAPEHQSNAITFGTVKDYVKTEVQADKSLSNVQFSVIYHDAYIDNGSSGGPLIDADYKIVGINYGGSEDNSISLAVPATKVNEFLKEFVYD